MNAQAKSICILGATGSIGENTLNVIRDYPERFAVVGLSAHRSGGRIAEQAAEFGVKHLALTGEGALEAPEGVMLHRGPESLVTLVEACAPDLVVVATVGSVGLTPTLRAIELGIPIALANKEVLVTAGELVMAAAARRGVPILSIDSELNAIAQCLEGNGHQPLRRVILTASGGPFRGWRREALETVTREQALAHPTWEMGPKITIDSATMMNKGFEVIEVHHLFNQPPGQIEVIIHPQSVIHSMVEFADGGMLAQMGVTDMYLPILNAMTYPERVENRRFEPLDLAKLGSLTFEAPAPEAFPCLDYAYRALAAGGTYPTVLNAANEVAVARFLAGEIGFTAIPERIDAALQAHTNTLHPDLAAISEADQWGRAIARGA